MRRFKVRNWSRYQSTGESHTWIRLSVSIFSDLAIAELTSGEFAGWIAVLVAAKREGNSLPYDESKIKRAAGAGRKVVVNLDRFYELGLIEDIEIEDASVAAARETLRAAARNDFGRRENYVARFNGMWAKAMGGELPWGRLGRALKPLVDKNGEDKVAEAFERYLSTVEKRFASPESFAARFGLWAEPQKNETPGSKPIPPSTRTYREELAGRLQDGVAPEDL